jgi:SGNH hydrolase-like domain, acetyltransferase AlgX
MPLKRFVLRAAAAFLFVAYVVFSSTLLLFTVLELAPSLTRHTVLRHIPYFAQKRHYRADPTLVFVPSQIGYPSRWDTEFVGDQYSSAYGFPQTAAPYHASYTPDGFRVNSSLPPYDIALIGDSYVEIGETDQLTLTEQLTHVSGLRTFNLGRGWYGPFQYLELFKQYALRLKPRYVVLCFFDGNDAEDTDQYLRWQNGERYYHFVIGENYLSRYFVALRDSYDFLVQQQRRVADRTRSTNPARVALEPAQPVSLQEEVLSSGVHPDLGLIAEQDRLLPMHVKYWNRPLTMQQLLESAEWQAIGRVLKDFRRLAAENGIVPVVLFIPKKAEVYGAFYSPRSGRNFLQRLDEHMRFRNNSHDALLAIAEQTGIRTVDLLPAFRALAGEGKILYYSFDTHWNPAGRRTAAEILSASLRELSVSAASICPGCDETSPRF